MTPPVLNNDKRLFKLGGVIQQDEAFCWLCLGLCIARDS